MATAPGNVREAKVFLKYRHKHELFDPNEQGYSLTSNWFHADVFAVLVATGVLTRAEIAVMIYLMGHKQPGAVVDVTQAGDRGPSRCSAQHGQHGAEGADPEELGTQAQTRRLADQPRIAYMGNGDDHKQLMLDLRAERLNTLFPDEIIGVAEEASDGAVHADRAVRVAPRPRASAGGTEDAVAADGRSGARRRDLADPDGTGTATGDGPAAGERKALRCLRDRNLVLKKGRAMRLHLIIAGYESDEDFSLALTKALQQIRQRRTTGHHRARVHHYTTQGRHGCETRCRELRLQLQTQERPSTEVSRASAPQPRILAS
ncbi:hypothetical protein ACU686_13385 [Yinghuangia aomiensis]